MGSGDDFLLGSAPCLRATSVDVRARATLSRDVRTSPTRQESPTAAICTKGGLTQKETVVPTRCATASRLSETSGDDFYGADGLSPGPGDATVQQALHLLYEFQVSSLIVFVSSTPPPARGRASTCR